MKYGAGNPGAAKNHEQVARSLGHTIVARRECGRCHTSFAIVARALFFACPACGEQGRFDEPAR